MPKKTLLFLHLEYFFWESLGDIYELAYNWRGQWVLGMVSWFLLRHLFTIPFQLFKLPHLEKKDPKIFPIGKMETTKGKILQRKSGG